ncbi:S1C family serine protease [Deinococcus oregonensis]|uniref:S1C family serine protease n=1 Tax=Deinococcus oregonensis TaxID=1805970 RepID=A0ABV6B0R6_9DEIO
MSKHLAAFTVLALTTPLTLAQTSPQTSSPTAPTPAVTAPLPVGEQGLVQVIDRSLAGILYITATVPGEQGTFNNPLFTGEQEAEAGGSGFFVNAQGFALTNYHVIEGATRITVNLRDSDQDFVARVVGTAPDYDLALIQVQGVPAALVRPLPLGNSNALKVGQSTIALGAPFGLQFSASTGIVSALQRTIPTGARQIPQTAIQTDAAVNPGNSGGPLLNSAGQVIGINTQILSPSGAETGVGQNAGVGFAVPINVAAQLLPRPQAGQTILGPVLGVTLAPFDLTDLTDEARSRYKFPREGAIVSQVAPEGPAARAGLKGGSAPIQTPVGTVYLGGDVITAMDGRAVKSAGELREQLFTRQAGDRVNLTVN